MSTADMRLTPLGLWFWGKRFPCTIGRGGIVVDKTEGDGGTPKGVHQVTGMLYRPDRLTTPAPWARPIGLRDGWCDDPAHPAYNHLIQKPFKASHESLRRADPMYDIILLTDWNWPDASPGKGSAIFLHAWRRPVYPTAGCIGFKPEHLRWITQRITPGTRVIV